MIDGRQSATIPGGEVVVGGDNMNRAPQQSVEGGGIDCRHRLALAGRELDNPAGPQVAAGQQLLVGGAKAEFAALLIATAANRLVEIRREQQVAAGITAPAG